MEDLSRRAVRRGRLLVALAALASLALIWIWRPGGPEDSDRRLDRVRSLLDAGHAAAALGELRDGGEPDPRARLLTARALIDLAETPDDLRTAWRHLATARASGAPSADLERRAHLRALEKRWYLLALRLFTTPPGESSPDVIFETAGFLAARGAHRESAEKYIEAAVRPDLPADRRTEAFGRAGVEWMAAGDISGAAGAWGADPSLAHLEATALEQAGDWLQALARYSVSPLPEARLGRARLLESLGRLKEALEELNRLVDTEIEYRGAADAARAGLLLRLGRVDEAREALSRDALRGFAARVLASFAVLDIRRRSWEEALDHLRTAQANAATSVRSGHPQDDLDGTGLVAAEVLAALGRRDEAVVVYESLIRSAADPAWKIAAHTGLARLGKSGEPSRAEAVKARELMAASPGARWLEPLVALAERNSR